MKQLFRGLFLTFFRFKSLSRVLYFHHFLLATSSIIFIFPVGDFKCGFVVIIYIILCLVRRILPFCDDLAVILPIIYGAIILYIIGLTFGLRVAGFRSPKANSLRGYAKMEKGEREVRILKYSTYIRLVTVA